MIKSTVYMLYFISTISFIYSIIIAAYSGIQTSFLWFWPFLGICCFGYARLLNRAAVQAQEKSGRFPALLLTALFWFAFLFLFLTECLLLHTAKKEPSPNVSHIIILGAQVRGDTPSLSLQARIDTAAEFMLAHPQVTAICSGGQGPGENKTEAAAIRDGLIAAGIASDRILLEEASTSTVENLRFSQPLLPSPSSSTVIVTNDFHCLRAGLIAGKCGYTDCSTLAAKQFLLTTPHYYIREFFALLKDFFAGNL